MVIAGLIATPLVQWCRGSFNGNKLGKKIQETSISQKAKPKKVYDEKAIQQAILSRKTVAAGLSHIVAVKENGRVLATGKKDSGQCNVGDWEDIVAVAAGYYHSVGLKKDGTVIAVGNNDKGQCDVGNWENIFYISARNDHTVGLKKDGTVVAIGSIRQPTGKYKKTVGGFIGSEYYDYDGFCNVGKWSGIVEVVTTELDTIGLKKDGTLVAVGKCVGEENISDWKDIKIPEQLQIQ